MLVLGVDGGQSGIRLRDTSGRPAVHVQGVSRLDGDAVALVAAAVARGMADGGLGRPDRVVLGLTTAPTLATELDRLADLVLRATGAREVWISDDSVTAHAGALTMGPGVSLVVGTGVACLAVPSGRPAMILGGHGALLGDEGGAFWIGARGIEAVLRAAESRGPATALGAAAIARFGTIGDLHVRLHDEAQPVAAIASFAPFVLRAADDGDPVAEGIVAEAAAELAALGLAAAVHCRGDAGEEPVALALGGRLLAEGEPLRTRVEAVLARVISANPGRRVLVRGADASPLDGAVLLGSAIDPGPYIALVHRRSQGDAA